MVSLADLVTSLFIRCRADSDFPVADDIADNILEIALWRTAPLEAPESGAAVDCRTDTCFLDSPATDMGDPLAAARKSANGDLDAGAGPAAGDDAGDWRGVWAETIISSSRLRCRAAI